MRFLPALAVAVLLTMAAAPLAAQVDAGTCQLIDSRLVERRVQDGVATLYVTGPALARCAGDVEIRADSAVLLEATAEIRLFRNVLFRDPLRQLTSDRATYFDGPGRLHAVGNVEFVDRERGTTLAGPELDYFRETEARPEPRVVAIGRPRLVLVPETAPGAEPEEPFTVDADRMVVEGDDRLTASGRVEIARSDFDGSGREAFYDGGREFLELRGDARIAGEAFDLAAERIEARLPDGGIEQVLALRQARLEGEELTVTGDRIDLRFAGDELHRMIARGLPAGEDDAGELAAAIAEEFRMEADSLDAELPGQQLERVVAVGRARGESLAGFGGQRQVPAGEAGAGTATAARVNGIATDRDWITGDTITGFFALEDAPLPEDPAAPSPDEPLPDLPVELELELEETTPRTPSGVAPGDDAAERVVLRRLVSTGDARALFRSEDDDADPDRPALNYLFGDEIELTITAGELELGRVQGLRHGAFVDPAPITPGLPMEEGDEQPHPDVEAPALADPDPQVDR
jgi:hypothetical protein